MSQGSKKVLLAMSGGVDSSVAAALLKDQGYELTGVFMCLGASGTDGDSRGCCSPQDAADARRVAEALEIEMYVLNRYDMKKLRQDGWEYELTIPYENDEDLDDIIYDMLGEAADIAAARYCFIEYDVRALDDSDRAW